MRLGLTTIVLVTCGLALAILPIYLSNDVLPLQQQLDLIQDPKDRLTLQKDLLQYQSDVHIRIWTLIVQVVGGIVVAIGAYFAWSNLRLAERNLEITQRNLAATQSKLDVDRQAQLTNRFMQAIAQLGAGFDAGKVNIEVRLGGIYALERLARDSPDDHWGFLPYVSVVPLARCRNWGNCPSLPAELPCRACTTDSGGPSHATASPPSSFQPRV